MRLGQKSAIHFVSRVLASLLGFVATLYIARLLGAGPLGIYSLTISVVSWLALIGNLGITSAVKKRISEQEEPVAFAIAGLILTIVLFTLVTLGLFLFSGAVNNYVGHSVVHFIVAMVAVSLAMNLIGAVLNGQHLVHISGILGPIKIGSRAGIQIASLIAGLGLTGLFGGYIVGHLVVIVLGAFVAVRSMPNIVAPSKRHFDQLLSFAKFSWLGNLRSRAFNWVDIAVLGFFVENSSIGYYTASWNIAMFLILFGASLSQTLFPEISRLSAGGESESVSELVNSGLSYAGLFLIPGLVGGAILGKQILRIYGEDFTQAWIVLIVLIAAALIQSYQNQLTNALNATDRPEVAFRVNAIFIVSNVILNIGLIYVYGLLGAALATASAVGISLIAAYYNLSRIIRVSIPSREVGRQCTAAMVMGAVIFWVRWFEASYLKIGHSVSVLLFLVLTGAVVYFVVLLGISPQFRTTVVDNLQM